MDTDTPERRLPTALALMVAALLPHLPTLGTAFLADTHGLILNVWDVAVSDPWALLTKGIGGGFRPLTGASVFATAWWFEGAEAVHRGLQFLLHAATTLIAWRVALSLGLRASGAIVAALLFAWSPCAAMAVPWVAARPDVTAGLTAGLVYLAYLADRDRRTAGTLVRLYGACLLLVMSKEVVMLVPVVVVFAGRGRRRYLPLLLFTLGLIAIRIHFHSQYPDPVIQREYSPMTLLREPGRLPGLLFGGGLFAFSMLSCAVARHDLADLSWGIVPALLGWVAFVALVAATWRRAPLALAFGLALMAANVPFLARNMGGFRMYAPALFAMPVLVLALHRIPGRAGRLVPLLLLVLSFLGAVQHTRTWIRASDRFRDSLDRLEPHRRRIEAEWRETGQPTAIEVLGLPVSEGHIPLFPPDFTYPLLTLTSAYFTYYRSTDPNDPDYRQRIELRWYAAKAPEEYETLIRSLGYPIVTIDLRQ